MITVARLTPLAHAAAQTSLSALLTAGLLAALVLTVLPAAVALTARVAGWVHRALEVHRDVDRWIAEDAPRPEGSA